MTRLVERYPGAAQSHCTRTALRKVKMPAVQLQVLEPTGGTVTILLFSNIAPDDREHWEPILDGGKPLIWRNYEFVRAAKRDRLGRVQSKEMRLTWRLTEQVRTGYRRRIARTIVGWGLLTNGSPSRRLSPTAARAQMERLGKHLSRYPGLSGVRADVLELHRYADRIWRAAYPDEAPLVWPWVPWLRYQKPKLEDLSDIARHDEIKRRKVGDVAH